MWTSRAPAGPYTSSSGPTTFQYGIGPWRAFPGVDGDDSGIVANVSSLNNPGFTASAFRSSRAAQIPARRLSSSKASADLPDQ